MAERNYWHRMLTNNYDQIDGKSALIDTIGAGSAVGAGVVFNFLADTWKNPIYFPPTSLNPIQDAIAHHSGDFYVGYSVPFLSYLAISRFAPKLPHAVRFGASLALGTTALAFLEVPELAHMVNNISTPDYADLPAGIISLVGFAAIHAIANRRAQRGK